MNEVIPGILEKEWSEIERKLEIIKPFAKTAHIDIIDGKFVDNTTFLDPGPFKKYADDFLLELHLMVENPIDYLKPWAEAGFQRFLGHIEKMPDPVEFVAQGQLLGAVGFAIDGPTDIAVLDNLNLADLDCLLIYTSDHVGFSGPSLIDERLEKIRKIKEKYAYLPVEVDGGINDETIVRARSAGASRFVSTSFLFGEQNSEEKFRKLTSLVNE
jgi:ribulose-phosphate 3-epimerase